MIPKKIKITNFQNFQGTYEIDFSNITSAVVIGPNGAGKSSIIIDPIRFALFGDLRSTKEDLINDNENSCSVEFTFEKNQHTYQITRSLRRSDGKVSLSYEEEGIDKSERKPSATQERIDEILGFTDDLLISTCISIQDGVHALVNKAPGEKEKIFSKLLNFDVWFRKRQYVSDWLNNNEGLEKKIEQLKEDKAKKDAVIRKSKETTVDWGKKLAAFNMQEQALREKIKSYEALSKEQLILREEIHQLTNRLQNIKGQLQASRPNMPSLVIEEEIKHLQQKKDEASTLYTEYQTYSKEFNDYFNEVENKRFELQQLTHVRASFELLDKVPCINTHYHDQCHILADAHSLKKKVLEFAPDLKTYEKVVADIEREYDSLKVQKTDLSSTLFTIQSDISTYDKLTQISAASLIASQAQEGVIKELQLEYKETEDLLQKKEASLLHGDLFNCEGDQKQLLDLTSRITSLQTDLKHLKNALIVDLNDSQRIDEELSTLNESFHEYSNYKTLYQVYKDIPAVLLNDIIPQIETYANLILKDIFPGHQFIIRTHRETKKDTLVKTIDILCAYKNGLRRFESLSGSERFRYSLAFRLALGWVNSELYNIPLNFFIIDEGFGSLDDVGTTVVKELLRSVADKFKLFLVITHVEELKDTFDTQIIVNIEGITPRIDVIKVKAHYDVNIYD